MKKIINLRLAQPRGLCAGVERAIDIVERALIKYSAPLYVRHEIVHNAYVVNYFRDKGVIFIEEIDEVPEKATIIFSAHGVSKKILHQAMAKELHIIDATCPLVAKVHHRVHQYHTQGYHILMIGHKGHPEVDGTLGQLPSGSISLIESAQDARLFNIPKTIKDLTFVTQTTLSIDDTKEIVDILKSRFPFIKSHQKNEICYATSNRQQALKEIASDVDMMIIIGSQNSSNTSRLKELSLSFGLPTYRIDHPEQVEPDWFCNEMTVGISAGASVPHIVVQNIIDTIHQICDAKIVHSQGIIEKTQFKMIKELSSIKVEHELI